MRRRCLVGRDDDNSGAGCLGGCLGGLIGILLVIAVIIVVIVTIIAIILLGGVLIGGFFALRNYFISFFNNVVLSNMKTSVKS